LWGAARNSAAPIAVVMPTRLSAAVVAALTAVALAATLGVLASAGPASGDYAAPPFPRPAPDAAAGKPAYLAAVDAWIVLLDASGRVVRVGPKREGGVRLCPGGRRLVVAESHRGEMEVFSIGLWRLRTQRVPGCTWCGSWTRGA
jgi:hypothetical protein